MRPLNDKEYVALTIYGEARGESFDGKMAVASVLRNRFLSHRWGISYASVCLSPKQFSCWNVEDPNLPLLRTFGQALSYGTVPDDAAVRVCLWIADGVLGSYFPSTVEQATHYFAASMLHAPAWASTGHFVGQRGGHLFFEGVP
jgi:spore germination cell wall hydrolase CwlJ-like protein